MQSVCQKAPVFKEERSTSDVLVALPDVGPAGSVGKSEDGCLVFGQARYYSEDGVFYATQNVGSRYDTGRVEVT